VPVLFERGLAVAGLDAATVATGNTMVANVKRQLGVPAPEDPEQTARKFLSARSRSEAGRRESEC